MTAKENVTRSPKAGGEQERVKFEATDAEDDLTSRSPKADASIVEPSVSTSTIDGTVGSSWAPRPIAADAASGSMTSIPSPHRGSRDEKGAEKAKRKHGRRPKQENKNEHPSLPERLGNSAISSTLGILKLAGDVTLSTTGNILSPSLEMTKNVLLPSLFASIADYLGQISPQRLKDWFRIVSASIHHIVAVIVATENGSVFRHKILRVGGDLVDVASSDTSRQALMDGMACFVKLNEALHTPEFKAFLEQISVMGCRVVDVAAMGKNKKLVHDLLDLVWSGIELANDPATTVAFAEVAAYLCHALEMEDAAIHAIAKEREEINRTAAMKRRERDQYQTATYQIPMIQNPNATVEEVILSAFGVIQNSVEEAKLHNGEFDNGIPGSVVLGSEDGGESERGPSRAMTPAPAEGQVSEANSTADDAEDTPEENAIGIATNDIDVNYLREKIHKRVEDTKKEHIQTRRSLIPVDTSKLPTLFANTDAVDDGKKDIEELAPIAQELTPKHRNNNSLHFEESVEGQREGNVDSADTLNEHVPEAPSRQVRSKPKEGETPVAHFYRVLDEVLVDERKKAATKVLKSTGSSSFDEEDKDNLAPETLKRHVQEHRSEKRRSAKGSGMHPAIEKFIKENEMLVCGLVLGALAFSLVFFAFGCYGAYVFVFPPKPVHVPVPVPEPTGLGGGIHVPLVVHGNENEYVIRIVREVVHVDAKGETLRIEEETQYSDEL